MNALVCLCIGLTAVQSSLVTFGTERVVYFRDASYGLNPLAFFLGKSIAAMPRYILSPMVFLTSYYSLTGPRESPVTMYSVLLIAEFTCTGIGYVISLLMSEKNAVVAGVVYTLVAVMFGGNNPTLRDLRNMGPVALIGASTSWVRWIQEALFINEAETYPLTETITDKIEWMGYDMDNYKMDLGMAIVIGIVVRVVAFVLLVFKDRAKQR
eukprot:TRINITY_DN12798_c0_g1_i1.p1 TRINITY_DN12798_c0_g1~~TRINITY_DN12798_c0_g1_i1.p1  ORF type:complete len:211 (-),score=31.76 TRINITY_DN12798_c0_g1_i1:19-651(-)